MRKLSLAFALSLLALIGYAQQGHEIKVKINNLPNSTLILGHFFNSSMIPDDTIPLNANGEGVFKGTKAYPGGMYIMYLPNKTYFEFLLDKDQHFSLENDTSDYVKNMKITGCQENEVFRNYKLFLEERRAKGEALSEEKKANPDDKKKLEKLDKQIQELGNQVTAEMKRVSETYPNLFAATFLKATQEVMVPDSIPDKDKYIWYRNHFFDNFDVSDPRLLRTPLYKGKIEKYMKLVEQQPIDSLRKSIDFLINSSRTNDELFRFMMVHVFNHYASSTVMGHDALYVHVAENYYLKEATWSDTTFLNKTRKSVESKKGTLIGQTASPIVLLNVSYDHLLKSTEDTTALVDYFNGKWFNLHQVPAQYTVLMFWEATCSHCKKELPQLYEAYQRLKGKGIEVVAVNMLFNKEGKEKWAKFLKEKGLKDWINAWDPAYQSKFKDKFDIKSTPVLYLLDKDKKIVAKRISAEQTEEVLMDMILFDALKDLEDAPRLDVAKKYIASYSAKKSFDILKTVMKRHFKDDDLKVLDDILDKELSKFPADTKEPEKTH